MVIFDGDKEKACPMENCILLKPFDTSSKDDDYLVLKLWHYLCKLNPREDVRHSLPCFPNIQRTL